MNDTIIVYLCWSGYIAGFIDSEVSNRMDLYDVYVNLAESEITVLQQAKGLICHFCFSACLFLDRSRFQKTFFFQISFLILGKQGKTPLSISFNV